MYHFLVSPQTFCKFSAFFLFVFFIFQLTMSDFVIIAESFFSDFRFVTGMWFTILYSHSVRFYEPINCWMWCPVFIQWKMRLRSKYFHFIAIFIFLRFEIRHHEQFLLKTTTTKTPMRRVQKKIERIEQSICHFDACLIFTRKHIYLKITAAKQSKGMTWRDIILSEKQQQKQKQQKLYQTIVKWKKLDRKIKLIVSVHKIHKVVYTHGKTIKYIWRSMKLSGHFVTDSLILSTISTQTHTQLVSDFVQIIENWMRVNWNAFTSTINWPNKLNRYINPYQWISLLFLAFKNVYVSNILGKVCWSLNVDGSGCMCFFFNRISF